MQNGGGFAYIPPLIYLFLNWQKYFYLSEQAANGKPVKPRKVLLFNFNGKFLLYFSMWVVRQENNGVLWPVTWG